MTYDADTTIRAREIPEKPSKEDALQAVSMLGCNLRKSAIEWHCKVLRRFIEQQSGERAKIVAWLRSDFPQQRNDTFNRTVTRTLEALRLSRAVLADAIERGEHEK